jgi:uncharacterized protein YegP (UPF0339 family)
MYGVPNHCEGATAMAGNFELYKDKAGEFRFRLKDGDGNALLAGEGYKAKGSAENGIESIRKNAADDERYERKETSNGKYMFNLKAANGQVIGTSGQFASETERESAIASVKSGAAGAGVDDQTG